MARMRDLAWCFLEVGSRYLTRRSSRWNLVSIRRESKRKKQALELRCRDVLDDCSGTRCFVDGSASGDSAGFAVYYSPGHGLNISSALSLQGAGVHNVAEVVAIYAAVWRQPRDKPLALYTDSMCALQCVERFRDVGELPEDMPAPGRAVVAALCAALELRTAETALVKLPGHAKLEKHDVADALAKKARDERRIRLEIPPHFYDDHAWASPFSTALRIICLKFWYLLTQVAHSPKVGYWLLGTYRPQALALDCEMISPTKPADKTASLASVCVVDQSGNQIYFSFVRRKPADVKDYRFEISGLDADSLSNKNPLARDFRTVRDTIQKLVKGKLLVGHDIQHDLAALGLDHPHHLLRDTSLFFRDPQTGSKIKLKTLAMQKLGLGLQQRGRAHDPKEDATAAMLLYLAHRDQFESWFKYNARVRRTRYRRRSRADDLAGATTKQSSLSKHLAQ